MNRRSINAVTALVQYVFPSLPPVQGEPAHSYVQHPQGLSVADANVDFWERYNALPELKSEERDQPILAEIEAWRTSEQSGLIKSLLTERSRCVERFVGRFKAEELWRLLVETVEHIKRIPVTTWPDQTHPPGLLSIWRMMHRRSIPPDVAAERLGDMIASLIPQNLLLADRLLYYFGNTEARVPSLIDTAGAGTMRVKIRQQFYSKYLGRIDLLAASLREAQPHLLRDLFYVVLETGSPAVSTEWTQLASELLRAAPHDDKLWLPIVRSLVTSRDRDCEQRDPGRCCCDLSLR